jgi:Tol biopolymer transport system component
MLSRRLAWAMGPVLALLLIAACVGDDPAATPAEADAGSLEGGSAEAAVVADTSVGVDAADASRARCDPGKPFGAPVLVSGLSTSADESTARLTADELTVFFARSVAGTGLPDIYVATRSSREAGWGAAAPVNGINTNGPDYAPSVTDDGLTIFFTSDSAGTRGGADIFSASRANVSNDFPAGTSLGALGVVNTAEAESDPYVLPNGKAIWFDVYNGPGDQEIYRAALGPAGFLPREKVLGVGSAKIEAYPVVTPDELTLYFASNRTDPQGSGDYDIYVATRTTTSASFGTPTILPLLNSAEADFPTWLSRDGCVLYLTRHASGNYDIYRAERPQ